MENVSLTEFIDYVNKRGTPKATVVRNFKERENEEYEPAKDFYKSFREAVVDMHLRGRDVRALDDMFKKLTDAKKIKNYPAMIAGYKKYLGKKNVTWFKPRSSVWSSSGMTVAINPELGIDRSGQRCVVKMFLKNEILPRDRALMITTLMEEALGPSFPGVTFCVLDVRSGRAYEHAPLKDAKHLLEAEAASFMSLYRAL